MPLHTSGMCASAIRFMGITPHTRAHESRPCADADSLGVGARPGVKRSRRALWLRFLRSLGKAGKRSQRRKLARGGQTPAARGRIENILHLETRREHQHRRSRRRISRETAIAELGKTLIAAASGRSLDEQAAPREADAPVDVPGVIAASPEREPDRRRNVALLDA